MIIDTDNYADHGIETFTFPGGEHHCHVPKLASRTVHVYAKIRSAYDWMTLKVVCDALRRAYKEIYLFLPYMPGARQDRETSVGSPVTVEIFARDLANMVNHVTVVDIHSADALKIMEKIIGKDHVTARAPHFMLANFVKWAGAKPDYIIAPDKGAVDRARQAAFAFNHGHAEQSLPVIECTKERDPDTGKLSHFVVPDLGGHNVYARYLIVDDICDGGGTFVGLLEAFREQNKTAPVDLWVTHGIFSKGFAPLKGFDNIFTTDSFHQDHDAKSVHVLPLLPHYLEGLTP